MATSRRCGVFGDLRGKPGNFGGFAVGFGGPGGARPAPPPSSVRRCAWLVGFVDSRSSSQHLKASGSWDWRRRGLGGGVVPVRNSDAPRCTRGDSATATPNFFVRRFDSPIRRFATGDPNPYPRRLCSFNLQRLAPFERDTVDLSVTLGVTVKKLR
ncbi:Os02g0580200 [Oryza sativa Japonica Group]|uniref:Os02g0580200 protein n=1 Tax=Oryza sativa subsp. japonica TaxID=39947 RepID=A0A0P0VL13_ORYSJ|nr:Os02g0580200 [Oryza sativa Japonica Group]